MTNSSAWDEINPPCMSEPPERDEQPASRFHAQRKVAELATWAATFAREGDLPRAKDYLNRAIKACDEKGTMQ